MLGSTQWVDSPEAASCVEKDISLRRAEWKAATQRNQHFICQLW